MLSITSGKIQKPLKALVYGPEGIGKTTFASKFPKPLFIDAEDGSNHLNVDRTQRPTSWTMLKGIIEELTKDAQGYKTLVIDTADWADKLAAAKICAKGDGKKIMASIEDFGYGKGWIMLSEEWKCFLDSLNLLQERQGMNVLFLAHSTMRKIEQPDEAGAYDHIELKMEKKSSSLLKEWCDLMLYAAYKTYVVKTGDGKNKAQSGQRVMYTTHHACWDAKNRFDLPEELPFEFDKIAHIFNALPQNTKSAETPKFPVAQRIEDDTKSAAIVAAGEKTLQTHAGALPQCLPSKLRDLMSMSAVTVDELMNCCRKTYPEGTPVEKVDPAFWEGKIIPGWDKILAMVAKQREINKAA